MEFRKMRRFRQQLSDEETEKILQEGKTAVLGVIDGNGYPYTVPVNYVYADGKIFFHCARQGEKLDAMRADDRVSLCVIEKADIVPEELTTYFRSVIVRGRAKILESPEEIQHAAETLGMKYYPNLEAVQKEIDRERRILAVVEVTIDHMTGKEAIELTKMRK